MPSKNDRSESGAQALVDALRQRSNGASGRPFPTIPHESEQPKQLPHQPAAPPQLPHAQTATTQLPHQPSPCDVDPDPEC